LAQFLLDQAQFLAKNLDREGDGSTILNQSGLHNYEYDNHLSKQTVGQIIRKFACFRLASQDVSMSNQKPKNKIHESQLSWICFIIFLQVYW